METQRIGNEASEVQKFFALDDWESKAFTPQEATALREAGDELNRGLPWLSATSEQAGKVAVLALLPWSAAGPRQDDALLRIVYFAKRNCQDGNHAHHEIIDAATSSHNYLLIAEEWARYAPKCSFFQVVGELHKRIGLNRSFQAHTESELFAAISERLRHLETYKPTVGDFGVEALQNAFVGLMQSKYDWGRKGLPTKREVKAMAQELLGRDGKSKPNSGWTGMRVKAGLDWLPEGKAGRPPKREVDETLKAKQQALSTLTKLMNAMGIDWNAVNAHMKARFGKGLALEEEKARLRETFGQPMPPSDDEESQ